MNVYDPHDKAAKIKRVYFYTLERDHALVEYFIRSHKDIAWDEMPRFIDEIAAEIADGAIPASKSVQGRRKWKRRSYFVYYDRTAGLIKDDAVSFSGDGTCFLDGADVSRRDGIYAFYCINHMRKGGHDQKPGDAQRFLIKVNHTHRTAAEDEPEKRGDAAGRVNVGAGRPIVTHDDSGTNTGPP